MRPALPLAASCALFVVVTGMTLSQTGCPPAAPAGEGEGEGAAGEGEGEGAGEGEGEGGGPCGALTAAGACTSATAGQFCDVAQGQSIDFDCATTRDDALCFVVNADHGVDCGVPTDAACFDDAHGALPCASAGFACVITSSTQGFCLQSDGCTGASQQCLGARAVLSCLGGSDTDPGQPALVDCASFGATCVDGAGCVAAPGSACTPGLTACGTAAAPAACPGDALCPPTSGEGEGEGEGEGGQ